MGEYGLSRTNSHQFEEHLPSDEHTNGPYPRLKVDTTASGAVGQAGGVLLTETIAVTGIGRELSVALTPWASRSRSTTRRRSSPTSPSHSPSAGTAWPTSHCCVPSRVYGLVASDATVSRTIDALAKDAPAALKAIDAARAAARSRAWGLAGTDSPDYGTNAKNPLIVDLDATLVASHSEKEKAEPTFKKCFGFQSIVLIH